MKPPLSSGRKLLAVSESASPRASASEDARFLHALEEYAALCRAGGQPDRAAFLTRYADLADSLADCLEGIEFVEQIAPQLRESSSGVSTDQNARDASLADSAFRTPGYPLGAALSTLGDFRIVRELGRGGMGVVYEAEQLSLGRRVALKILPFAAMLSETQLARFRNEARAAATLKHPNIVSIYSVGTERGVHYYAMELIEGASLAELIASLTDNSFNRDPNGERVPELVVSSELSVARSSPATDHGQLTTDPSATDHGQLTTDQFNAELRTPNSALETQPIAALATERSSNPRAYVRRVAEIGVQIAEALHHAHEHGILHRDVKPANILLDGDGKPWITDFGLARIETDSRVTVAGDLLGTLRYMPPEQTDSQGILDGRSDVYSLGATLYEALTLRPVFTDTDRPALLRRIADDDPTPPRRLRPEIPADLETIVQKTLAKEPHDRYATAAELAADLRRFLESQPIRARRASPLSRIHKWGRRHIAAVMGVSVMLAISLTVLGVAFALVATAQHAKNDEQKAKISAQNAQNAEQQAKIAALEDAQKNLAVATDAVDDLYTNFAAEWIAKETAPSNLQQQFLHKAADFYRRIVERPVQSPRDRLTHANAYYRIGDLELYLENFEEAVGPLEKSVDLTHRLREEFPTEAAYHEALADRSLDLGHAYRELQDFDKAEATFREVLSLLEEFPDGETKADQIVTCKLQQAEVMQRQGKLDEALRLMVELRDQLLKANPPGTYYPLSLIDCRYRIASILLDQDQLGEAEKTHEEAHGQCRGMRGLMYEDSRALRRTEMGLLVQCGDIAARQGDLENAIAHYRESLELQRQSFKEQRTPEQFNNAKHAGEVSSEPEPGPFARYVETQLRLADVLRRAGRPYDAEAELTSCEYVTRVLAGIARPNALRYRILRANVWAMAAHHAATQERPDEATGPRRIAARIWLDALEEFPHAADYQSGVHGRHSDLAWFRKSFPGELTEYAATPDEADNFRDTPFGRRATAVAAFRRDDWQVALREFARSAQVRSNDQAYDWLHVAICRAKLGHAVQAKNYYEAAAEHIDAMEVFPPDLLQIAEQAKQLVDTLPMPESYYKFDRVFVEPDAHGLAAARQIRVGPDGNIYVASHDTDVVKVFDPNTGELLRDLGTSGGELDGPWALLFGPDGRLYVGGRYSRNVVRFDVITGNYSVVVSSKRGGLGAPRGLAIGPDGNLYVSSHVERTPYTTATVKRYDDKTGAYMGDFVTEGTGGLSNAVGLSFGPDGHLYVASPGSGAVNIYHGTTGDFLKVFISGYVPGVNGPSLIEFHNDGFAYVSFGKSHEIMRFDASTGNSLGLIFPAGVDESELIGMPGFAIDRDGRLYVSTGTPRDQRGSRVLRYTLK